MHSYLRKDDSYSFSLLNEKKKKLVQKSKLLKNYLFVRNEICIWMKKILDELNLFK